MWKLSLVCAWITGVKSLLILNVLENKLYIFQLLRVYLSHSSTSLPISLDLNTIFYVTISVTWKDSIFCTCYFPARVCPPLTRAVLHSRPTFLSLWKWSGNNGHFWEGQRCYLTGSQLYPQFLGSSLKKLLNKYLLSE